MVTLFARTFLSSCAQIWQFPWPSQTTADLLYAVWKVLQHWLKSYHHWPGKLLSVASNFEQEFLKVFVQKETEMVHFRSLSVV